jgi:RNA polymerase subunit RPABC4/transcription elongation factor Spt4
MSKKVREFAKECVICGSKEPEHGLAHIMTTSQKVCPVCANEKTLREIYKAAIIREEEQRIIDEQGFDELEDNR